MARRGKAKQARHGVAWRGAAWQSRRGLAWTGLAWRGLAGEARLGAAMFGRRGMVWLGVAQNGRRGTLGSNGLTSVYRSIHAWRMPRMIDPQRHRRPFVVSTKLSARELEKLQALERRTGRARAELLRELIREAFDRLGA